jgi:cytochrome c-type biogenesis protein CcmH
MGKTVSAFDGAAQVSGMSCRFALAMLLVGFASLAVAVDKFEPLPDGAQQQRYLGLTHELRCVQCQNETIADSPVEVAADLRREVREAIQAGKTDDEIRDGLVSRYGEFILFKPRWSARNALLWLAPGLMLLVGLVVGFNIVRRRAQLLPVDDSVVEEEDRT